jgi:DNA mismatch endonuclease (patch repair protein)
MDVFSAKKRSEVMSAIRSRDTKPEIAVRCLLHRKGFRFVLHDARLPGKPDIVLPKYRVAVQVRGCFWHGHNCHDGHIPKSRREYWEPKIANNKRRDRRSDAQLKKLGWRLFVLWECDCMKEKSLQSAIGKIVQTLAQ